MEVGGNGIVDIVFPREAPLHMFLLLYAVLTPKASFLFTGSQPGQVKGGDKPLSHRLQVLHITGQTQGGHVVPGCADLAGT